MSSNISIYHYIIPKIRKRKQAIYASGIIIVEELTSLPTLTIVNKDYMYGYVSDLNKILLIDLPNREYYLLPKTTDKGREILVDSALVKGKAIPRIEENRAYAITFLDPKVYLDVLEFSNDGWKTVDTLVEIDTTNYVVKPCLNAKFDVTVHPDVYRNYIRLGSRIMDSTLVTFAKYREEEFQGVPIYIPEYTVYDFLRNKIVDDIVVHETCETASVTTFTIDVKVKGYEIVAYYSIERTVPTIINSELRIIKPDSSFVRLCFSSEDARCLKFALDETEMKIYRPPEVYDFNGNIIDYKELSYNYSTTSHLMKVMEAVPIDDIIAVDGWRIIDNTFVDHEGILMSLIYNPSSSTKPNWIAYIKSNMYLINYDILNNELKYTVYEFKIG